MRLKEDPPPAADSPTDRWEQQIRKGTLEMAALAALWTGKLYGLEIIRYLENNSQLILSEGTIYPLLSRLKTEGLVASEWVEAEGGHPRKYYWLTKSGKRRIEEMVDIWHGFSRGLNQLIKPVLTAKMEKEEVVL